MASPLTVSLKRSTTTISNFFGTNKSQKNFYPSTVWLFYTAFFAFLPFFLLRMASMLNWTEFGSSNFITPGTYQTITKNKNSPYLSENIIYSPDLFKYGTFLVSNNTYNTHVTNTVNYLFLCLFKLVYNLTSSLKAGMAYVHINHHLYYFSYFTNVTQPFSHNLSHATPSLYEWSAAGKKPVPYAQRRRPDPSVHL